MASDGCEVDTFTDPANCSGCGIQCVLANATGGCAMASCVIESCNPGFGSCDGNDLNGCETPLTTLTNCGQCFITCTNLNGNTSCAGGVCAPTCNAPFGDCDGDVTNGCETNTSTSLAHCGGCSMPCAGTCTGGMCI